MACPRSCFESWLRGAPCSDERVDHLPREPELTLFDPAEKPFGRNFPQPELSADSDGVTTRTRTPIQQSKSCRRMNVF